MVSGPLINLYIVDMEEEEEMNKQALEIDKKVRDDPELKQ